MEESGVTSARQAFVSVRLGYYEEMILDPEVLRRNRWPHNLELLRIARETGCRVGLATMSGRDRTRQALEALDLTDAFDVVATRDDVQQGKPDPEIYRLVSRVLGLPAERTLVVEDSPSGVEAALAAGMHCLAVTTPFTRERMHAQGLLEDPWIVDDAATLPDVVRRMIEASE